MFFLDIKRVNALFNYCYRYRFQHDRNLKEILHCSQRNYGIFVLELICQIQSSDTSLNDDGECERMRVNTKKVNQDIKIFRRREIVVQRQIRRIDNRIGLFLCLLCKYHSRCNFIKRLLRRLHVYETLVLG